MQKSYENLLINFNDWIIALPKTWMLLLATKTVSYFRIKTFRNATTFLCLLLIKCENIFYVCQYNFSRIRRRRLHYVDFTTLGI
jgi:hypothetical protein